MLEDAEWIWNGRNYAATFKCEFTADSAILEIAAENDYAAYVNGKLAAFGSYKGYKNRKFVDSADLTEFMTEGKNTLEITVWYYGLNTSVNIDDGAGVIFRVQSHGKTVAASGAHTHSRIENRYKNGYKKLITVQLGYSFKYDPTAENGEYTESEVVDKCRNFFPRPVKKLKMTEPPVARLVKSGNGSYLYDLGREVAGVLSLSVTSAEKQNLLIAFGEHIDDGKVRRLVGGRDFSVEYVAPKGKSEYVNPFRRLGCRYLEVFADKPIEFEEITVIPTEYPLKALPYKANSDLRQKIYDTSVETLKLCMHEHYEDCPWREQALYTFDGRNEMLFTYYAFGEYEFARANLLLIAHGVRADGMLELTYPAVNTPAIPMFSLAYVWQVYEYVKHSGDKSILTEVLPVLEGIMKNFRAMAKNGLVSEFQRPFWNFYEWAEGSDGGGAWGDENEERYSLILNCLYVYAEEKYSELCGKNETDVAAFKSRIKQAFYNREKGLFRAYVGSDLYTVFGNSAAILIGLGNEETAENMLKDKDVVPVTLSAAMYFYDALLSFGDKYKDYVLNKLDTDYGYMLNRGATSFWETIDGAGAFDEAGSLCHGWSALPIYYYRNLTYKGN